MTGWEKIILNPTTVNKPTFFKKIINYKFEKYLAQTSCDHVDG